MLDRDLQLSQLYMLGMGHVQVREVCEALYGHKLSRLCLYDRQLAGFAPWCQRHGLQWTASDYFIQENILTERKGRWSNIGRRFTASGMRFVYLSIDRHRTAEASRVEQYDDFAPDAMGEMLSIPPCCIAFFKRHKSAAIEHYMDDYCPLICEASMGDTFDWRMNYLAQYFGCSLLSHYPCNWRCPGSLQRAKQASEMVRSISPEWHGTFESLMKSVALFQQSGEVHLLLHPHQGHGWNEAPPQSILSTAPSALSDRIRDSGGIFLKPGGEVGFGRDGGNDPSCSGVTAIAFVDDTDALATYPAAQH